MQHLATLLIRLVALAIWAAVLTSCFGVPTEDDPREYLDQDTAATISIVNHPLVFARERPERAVHMRDYVTVAAAAVDRGGKTDYLLITYFWTTLDFHGREGESRSLGESDPHAIEMIIIADDRRIKLKPGTQSPRDLGIGSNVHAPPTGSAVQSVYRLDLPTLRFVSAAHHLALVKDADNTSAAFELWSDQRASLRGLVKSLSGQ